MNGKEEKIIRTEIKATCAAVAGFNNRLRGIISLWRCCDSVEKECGIRPKFSITWPITDICTGKYEDVLLNEISIRESDQTVCTTKSDICWRLTVYESEVPSDFAKAWPYHGSMRPSIEFEYERIPQKVRDLFLPYFNKLQFHPSILKKAGETKPLPGSIGVYCREAADWTAHSRSLGLQKYFDAIDVYAPANPIYLSAHTEEIAKQFIERYGSRIQVQPNKDYSSKTGRQLQHAIVDMKVMSDLPMYIGDGLSSFLEDIWWLGGCKAKVIRLSNQENI